MITEMRQEERTRYRRKVTGESPLSYGRFDSPIGPIYVAVDGKKVIALSFTSKSEGEFFVEVSRLTTQPLRHSDESVRAFIAELREYFAGKRKKFTFSGDLSGYTDFQRQVLNAAARIPYGEVRSYEWLAERANRPHAARAVGQVMARNPVPIIIPCHRVIGSSGQLCGFAGGLRALDLKRKLLSVEGIKL